MTHYREGDCVFAISGLKTYACPFEFEIEGVRYEFLGSGTYNVAYKSVSEPYRVYKQPFLLTEDTDLPKRAVRVWNEINPENPAWLVGAGWSSPFIDTSIQKASDEDIAKKLIDIYMRTGRIVADAYVPGNFIKTSDGVVVCVDVGYALKLEKRLTKEKSQVSLEAWNGKEGLGLSGMRQAFHDVYKREFSSCPRSISAIRALLFLQLWEPDLLNESVGRVLKDNPNIRTMLGHAYERDCDASNMPILQDFFRCPEAEKNKANAAYYILERCYPSQVCELYEIRRALGGISPEQAHFAMALWCQKSGFVINKKENIGYIINSLISVDVSCSRENSAIYFYCSACCIQKMGVKKGSHIIAKNVYSALNVDFEKITRDDLALFNRIIQNPEEEDVQEAYFNKMMSGNYQQKKDSGKLSDISSEIASFRERIEAVEIILIEAGIYRSGLDLVLILTEAKDSIIKKIDNYIKISKSGSLGVTGIFRTSNTTLTKTSAAHTLKTEISECTNVVAIRKLLNKAAAADKLSHENTHRDDWFTGKSRYGKCLMQCLTEINQCIKMIIGQESRNPDVYPMSHY